MPNQDELIAALRQQTGAQAQMGGLNRQMAQAEALRGSPMPQMSSQGYVSPLAVLANVMGSSRGRQQQRELEPQMKQAQQQIADAGLQEKLYGLKKAKEQQVRKQMVEDRTFQGTLTDRFLKDQRETAEATEGKRRWEQEQAAVSGTGTTYANPDGTGSVVTFQTNKGPVDSKGKPVDLAGKVPYAELAKAAKAKAGKTTKMEQTQQAQNESAVNSASLVSKILDSSVLEGATGFLDPEQWAGRGGYGPDGVKIQALHNDMERISVDSVKPLLSGLGVNPTDADLGLALGSIPGKFDQPKVWAEWARDQFVPGLEQIMERERKAGTLTEEAEANMNALIMQTTVSALKRLEPEAFNNQPDQQAQPTQQFAGFSAVEVND